MDGISFDCCGVRIGVRANNSRVLERLRSCLPPIWNPIDPPIVDYLYSFWVGGEQPVGNVREFNIVYIGTQQLIRSLDVNKAFNCLESTLHLNVASSASDRVFVHAGVVEWQRRAILIPGHSMSGKTTLVAALVEAGATYFSDSYAVIDSLASVHPYAKRLSIRENGAKSEKRVSITDLGGHAGTEPVPVGLLAFLHYEPVADWRPRVLSAGGTTLALLPNTFGAPLRPQFVLETLGRLSSATLAIRSKRGDARDIAEVLLDLSTR